MCILIANVYISFFYTLIIIHAPNIWKLILLLLGVWIECKNWHHFKIHDFMLQKQYVSVVEENPLI
jgi:hypothetical protein